MRAPDSPEQRLVRTQKTMTPGSLGGRVAAASPARAPVQPVKAGIAPPAGGGGGLMGFAYFTLDFPDFAVGGGGANADVVSLDQSVGTPGVSVASDQITYRTDGVDSLYVAHATIFAAEVSGGLTSSIHLFTFILGDTVTGSTTTYSSTGARLNASGQLYVNYALTDTPFLRGESNDSGITYAVSLGYLTVARYAL